MINLEERNRKIIDAVISKANIVCPGSLALIGITGSFMTGDFYEKSDLDLLILINDDKGWRLGCSMIQDDLQVGHDIYCTKWEDLEYDAKYEHPHISKLMDAKIVYCADEKYKKQLDVLRHKAREIMEAPFSAEDYEKAEKVLKEAEHFYAMAMISDDNSKVSEWAGGAVYYVENAVAMLNKQYFHYGVKRVYEELSVMKNRPENLCDMIDHVVSAASATSVKEHLTTLMKETLAMFYQVKETIPTRKKPVIADTIGGTYEEMYSNWRNKMYLAAATGDRHLAFMSLISASAMFAEISNEVNIDSYNILNCYDSEDLHKTAAAYDDILNEYLREYKKGGISEKRYADIDAFVLDYQI
ncbi:MAG: hypothetical protein K2H37_12030 [Lachnospiraceae bacterium]|nr:hypothetical protein [Lachnospiraceae bacterium]